jgi:hypothetical protein
MTIIVVRDRITERPVATSTAARQDEVDTWPFAVSLNGSRVQACPRSPDRCDPPTIGDLMPSWINRFKPVAPRRVQLLLAALAWTVVGCGLGTFGVIWLVDDATCWSPILGLLAVVLGLMKGRFILRQAADRVTRRIAERGEDRCVGGFFSWTTWLLVLVMMALGQVLRRSPLPLWALGLTYLAVGVALLAASRHLWSARRTVSTLDQPAGS